MNLLNCVAPVVIVAAAACPASAVLYSHTLSTAATPASQGYQYFAVNSPLAESQVFSTDGSVITSNTMGNGFQGQGANSVHLSPAPGEYETGQDFVVEARVRVLEGERVSFHFGFYIGAWFDGLNASVGIMPGTMQSSGTLAVLGRDNTLWTDWRLVTDRMANVYRVYANGELQFTDVLLPAVGSPGFGLPENYITFGDGTGGANARAEISAYRFYQVPIPAPAGVSLAVLAGAMTFRRRRA